MSGSDDLRDRKKAVQLSAELLRDAGIAFFPIEAKRIFRSFRHQIRLHTYQDLQNASGQIEGASPLKQFSEDGFSIRIRDVLIDLETGPVTANLWDIYYNSEIKDTRIRFTLMHELGHILLNHHQILNTDSFEGMQGDPFYRLADTQADWFSISLLAPAPAVYRLLKEHGFSMPRHSKGIWTVTDSEAPMLKELGSKPDPTQLVSVAFGISRQAAERRLSELPEELALLEEADKGLFCYLEQVHHRSGWYCWVCNTRRQASSTYCTGCGKGWHYEYRDYGRFSRPVMELRENGQFAFCSVCGNDEYGSDASYCPVCGSPVVNECENARYAEGDFIRSGMNVIRGTHRCRPTDIFCGVCGVTTAFGSRHGPKENLWLPGKNSDRCRTKSTVYPTVLKEQDSHLPSCPVCGSKRTIREGRYCADCMQPLQNVCTGPAKHHACAVSDRFCQACGAPTVFFQSGFLPDYTTTETYATLLRAENENSHTPAPEFYIFVEGITSTTKETR